MGHYLQPEGGGGGGGGRGGEWGLGYSYCLTITFSSQSLPAFRLCKKRKVSVIARRHYYQNKKMF